MGTYEMQLRQLAKKIAISFGLGTLLSIPFAIKMGESFGDGIAYIVGFGFLFGSIISILWSAKAGMLPTLADLVLTGVKSAFVGSFSAMFTNGLFGIIVGVIGAMLSMILVLAATMFLTVTFPLHLLFLVAMTVMERMERLPSDGMIAILEMAVPAIGVIVTVIYVWQFLA